MRIALARRLPALALFACFGTLISATAAATDGSVNPHLDRAAQLCATLHTLPAQRKQECCGAQAADLADLCTQTLGKILERKHAAVDGDALAACASATREHLQGCDWVGPLQPSLPNACATLIKGGAEAGTQCQSSLECADGLYCRGLSPLAAGTCALPAEPGQRCETPADPLASLTRSTDDPRHRVCNGLCLRGQCLAQVAEGGRCHASSVCANGLSCVEGQCQSAALPQLGQACSPSPGCRDNALCLAGTCTAPKAAGESCKLPFECRSFHCEIAAGATTGQCADACASTNSSVVQIALP
jgi:hypothetical protein